MTHARTIDRRAFTVSLAAVSTAAWAGLGRAAWGSADPFTLGIASGDPHADGVVLWTRLAPQPLAPDGGMPTTRIPVTWEVATDERFTAPRRGIAYADPAWGHSVHVEVAGLASDRPYFYRFVAGGVSSPIGRTRTAPAPGALVDRLRVAFASCQHYEAGFYAAYRHMVADAPDLVLFLGDYIYEGNPGTAGVRRHLNPEPTDLAGYRLRYATYKSDPLLQRAHEAAPWVVTWDDHEVQDDYSGTVDKFYGDRRAFARRRAAAYRAYFEHMPLRTFSRPDAHGMRLYRTIDWGALAQFQVIDDRQFRDTAACQPAGLPGSGRQTIGLRADCPERHDPRRQLLGRTQADWLDRELQRTRSTWSVLAQQTLMMPYRRTTMDAPDAIPTLHSMDGWEGYTPARERILRRYRASAIRNPLILSGDIHAFVAGDHFDPDDPTRVVAAEFVGGSISSGGRDTTVNRTAMLNPGFRFAENQVRGYGRLDLTPDAASVTLRGLADVRDPQSPARDLAQFAVAAGKPGIQQG